VLLLGFHLDLEELALALEIVDRLLLLSLLVVSPGVLALGVSVRVDWLLGEVHFFVVAPVEGVASRCH